jgi:hypothetical protein
MTKMTGHVRFLCQTYPARGLKTSKSETTGHVQPLARTYLALGLKGIKRVSHTPLNPSLSFALHFNSLCLQRLHR